MNTGQSRLSFGGGGGVEVGRGALALTLSSELTPVAPSFFDKNGTANLNLEPTLLLTFHTCRRCRHDLQKKDKNGPISPKLWQHALSMSSVDRPPTSSEPSSPEAEASAHAPSSEPKPPPARDPTLFLAQQTTRLEGVGLSAKLGKIWLKSFDWKVEGGHPGVKKAVLVAAPHTSNWDLPFALAGLYVIGLPIRFVAKRELFRGPLGPLMTFLGGLPVDRKKTKGFVSAAADWLKKEESLFLLVAPEGTRSKATRWKTGFYHIAKEANCPIILAYLNYEKKTCGLGHLFYPTGDLEKDFAAIAEFYRDKVGKNPNMQGEVRVDSNT